MVLPAERYEVVGFAHHTLARLLLAMYNPKGLTLGPQAIGFHKRMEVRDDEVAHRGIIRSFSGDDTQLTSVQMEVQDQVRAMCGVARYNSCPVGRSMACLAIKLGSCSFRLLHAPVQD